MGKKKVLSEGQLREMVMPGEGQLLGIVTQMLGYDRLLVKCGDGHERVCRIRGKMKRRVWIKVGDVVLLPGHGYCGDGEFLPGAYLVETIEHFYTRVEYKGSRPQEARLTKAVAQVTSLNPSLTI